MRDCDAQLTGLRNTKATQCAALKVVGPHGLKDYELARNAASLVKSCVA